MFSLREAIYILHLIFYVKVSYLSRMEKNNEFVERFHHLYIYVWNAKNFSIENVYKRQHYWRKRRNYYASRSVQSATVRCNEFLFLRWTCWQRGPAYIGRRRVRFIMSILWKRLSVFFLAYTEMSKNEISEVFF